MGALQDVLHLGEGEAPGFRREALGREIEAHFRIALLEDPGEVGACGEVGLGNLDHLGRGASREDFVRHVARGGGHEDDEGAPFRDLGLGGPAREGGDRRPLGARGGAGGGQGVGVVQDHRHPTGLDLLAGDEGVEQHEGPRGIGRQRPLEAQRLAQRLLLGRSAEGKARGDVVERQDLAAGAEPPQALGKGDVLRAERLKVAHVAVQEEEVAGPGLVSGQHRGLEPAGEAERLHLLSPNACRPRPLPMTPPWASSAGEDWMPSAARLSRARVCPEASNR